MEHKNTANEESSNDITLHDFVAYYRILRPEMFSDSMVVYEIPLTRELFDKQLELLSTKKMQSEFENFIVGCAQRLITPNIKPQTGPDGGGDGKVDAETYKVSSDISDKWYVAEGGALGDEKWAFAISCINKDKWKQKVAGDVEKIVKTGRGYTRALFFSNQFIKSSTRLKVEKELTEKHKIEVSIFDGLWCANAVFYKGCMDIALNCLCFSDDYKRKNEIIGPLDKQRRERLDEIEKNILRPIEGLDTGYVDELQEACLLSRGLELPRTETEGRFSRALRECAQHGSRQQQFNIIYDHAWTCFFWYDDKDSMYSDYIKLKEYVNEEISVVRIEKLTNLLTNLINITRNGFFEQSKLEPELEYIKGLSLELEHRDDKRSSLLFIRLYLAQQKLIDDALSNNAIDDDIDSIKPLLLEAPSHLDISFDTEFQLVEIMNRVIEDNQNYEDLVDELTSILKKTHSEQEAAQIELNRAMNLLDKGKAKQAVRHFSFCIRPFEREECVTELIKSSGMMGIALYELGLPYSAEAFLVKAASLLLRDFYNNGSISHLLLTVLQKLCEIELMLGRLVMFLNWYELMMIVSSNGQFAENEQFNNTNFIYDAAWACRFAASDLKNPIFGSIPDILERGGLFRASEYLKYALGYDEELEEEARNLFAEDGWQDKMLNQPIFKQFFCDLNISTDGKAELQTTVNNCTLHVKYTNSCQNQIVAEIFLGTLEAMLATMEQFEVLSITPDIFIEIIDTDNKSVFNKRENANEYQLLLNPNYNDKDLWECISTFIAFYFSLNAISKGKLETMLQSKQDGEKLMDRVGNLLQVKQSISNVLGNNFKYKIEDWQKESDKQYSLINTEFKYKPQSYHNDKQENSLFYSTNKDMSIWEGAGWKGCGFAFSQLGMEPPIFGLAFDNIEQGKTIVEEWKNMVVDGKRPIVIYIIRGINNQHPTWYRVCVAPKIIKEDNNNMRYMATMSRKHTMTPNSSWNLDTFEQLFKRFGGCWFTVFQLDNENNIIMSNSFDGAFKFVDIEFRNAWEIGMNDMAWQALESDDEPVIPESKTDSAPVLEVLSQLRDVRTNRGSHP